MQSTVAANREGKMLARLNSSDHLHVGAGLIRNRLEAPGLGLELHLLGQHHHKVLHRREKFGFDARRAGVRQVVGNLKLSFAGT